MVILEEIALYRERYNTFRSSYKHRKRDDVVYACNRLGMMMWYNRRSPMQASGYRAYCKERDILDRFLKKFGC
jgi:hypothetical protein